MDKMSRAVYYTYGQQNIYINFECGPQVEKGNPGHLLLIA